MSDVLINSFSVQPSAPPVPVGIVTTVKTNISSNSLAADELGNTYIGGYDNAYGRVTKYDSSGNSYVYTNQTYSNITGLSYRSNNNWLYVWDDPQLSYINLTSPSKTILYTNNTIGVNNILWTANAIYIADNSNNKILISTNNAVSFSTLVDNSASGDPIWGLAVDSQNNLYWTSYYNNKVYKRTTAGAISVFAGGGASSAPCPNTNLDIFYAMGICVDQEDSVYVADLLHHKIVKCKQDGNAVPFVGSGAEGTADGTGGAAQLTYPKHLVYVPTISTMYLLDNASTSIRKIV